MANDSGEKVNAEIKSRRKDAARRKLMTEKGKLKRSVPEKKFSKDDSDSTYEPKYDRGIKSLGPSVPMPIKKSKKTVDSKRWSYSTNSDDLNFRDKV